MPSSAQIEKYLTSTNPETRQNWASKQSYCPTAAQFDRGIRDAAHLVRVAWAKRIIPNFKPIDRQVNRGLSDTYWNVRLSWAMRKDFVPTYKQIDAGLMDDHNFVRQCWAERADITMSPEQVFIGLNDTDDGVFCNMASRREAILTMDQLSRLMNQGSGMFSDASGGKNKVIRHQVAMMALIGEEFTDEPKKRSPRL